MKPEFLQKYGVILEGHFLLASGMHSPYYLQMAKAFQYPDVTEVLAKEIVKIIKEKFEPPDFIASPAIGGIIIGYEVARQMGKRFIFFEKNEGEFVLRRNQTINKGEKGVIVEDVITTAMSSLKVKKAVEKLGARVVGITSVINRGNADFPAVFRLSFPTFSPEECPLCKKGIPLEKPGSGK